MKKNIIFSFFIKGASILLSLVMVPLTINYISPGRYGIWITLSTVITWFSFFDIGLGNGLRNNLSIALSRKDYALSKTYLSTTYAMLAMISSVLLLLFIPVNSLLNWSALLNAPPEMATELNRLALLLFVFFCVQLVLQIINVVLNANHEPAKVSLLLFISSCISLILILLFRASGLVSLTLLGISVTFPPLLVNTVFSIAVYRKKFKAFRPSFSAINFSYARDLLSLGSKFFIIQIAALILYQTSNIFIAHLCSTEEVTYYNVAYRYISVITFISGIIMAPLWNAFTEAFILKEFDWINKTIGKLKSVSFLLSFVVVMMVLVSQPVFRFWVSSISIPVMITVAVAITTIINIWNGLYSQFLNGTGKVMLQLYFGIFSAILNIPLSYFLGKYFGVSGVILSTAIVSLPGLILYPLQFKKIMSGNLNGIWNK